MLDVLIVGAGISGISAACHLRRDCPNKRFAIIEAREHIGGTWDLFKYPGIRSDSDMYTFGFDFKPWTRPKALADGPSILSYLEEVVEEYQLRPLIRFGQKVICANWSSPDSAWTITARGAHGETEQYKARVLFMCSGYYDYDQGYQPALPGMDDFKGQLVHPQHWPENLDYRNKRVAVIGSGATAVTLVPAMADLAARVTMVQRSPSYVVSRPGKDKIANLLNRILPHCWAYRLVRWRNIRFQHLVYSQSRKNPDKLKAKILHLVRKAMGPDYDVDRHFTPAYNPWDQRLCLVPDGDLFEAIKRGKAEVVTEGLDKITESGIRLKSGQHVDADIIVTATGLQMKLLGGASFSMDGEAIDFSRRYFYHGMMFSDVPNLIQTFGYINASWTLRADLNSAFVCRMLKRMDELDASRCVPVLRESEQGMQASDWVQEFTPGYMQRSMHLFPRQGDHLPWRNTQDYLLDRKLLGKGPLEDGVLQFLS